MLLSEILTFGKIRENGNIFIPANQYPFDRMNKAKVRKPAAVGFYEGNPSALRAQIAQCFVDGPGAPPQVKKGKGFLGAVVPHAGYMYSGRIAAFSYAEIAGRFPRKFVILGPNHTGRGSPVALFPSGAWETPLGLAPVDEALGKTIFRDIIDADESAHRSEHSIEVQLPFIQYLAAQMAQGGDFSFVPICLGMQDVLTAEDVGNIIAEALKGEESACIIASTDFSHVGFNYGEPVPAGKRIDQFAKEQDQKAIDAILKMDPQELASVVEEYNITMCGYGCVAAMLFAMKKLGASKARLLKYGSSYEVAPGSSCVGYGALIVE